MFKPINIGEKLGLKTNSDMYIIRADILRYSEVWDNAYFDNFEWTYHIMKATRFDDYDQAKEILDELENRSKAWVQPLRPSAVYEIVEIDF